MRMISSWCQKVGVPKLSVTPLVMRMFARTSYLLHMGDAHQAYELYQSNKLLKNNSEKLRLGLSKLLVQSERLAALSPLVHLPPNPFAKDYLAMRAFFESKNRSKRFNRELKNWSRLIQIMLVGG